MLSLTKEKYQAVCSSFSSLLVLNDDAEEALSFAVALLEAEAAAVRKNEPAATVTIHQLEAAAQELRVICSDISSESFYNPDAKN